MKALYFNEFGDSSVLQYGEVAEPQINENEVLIKTKYIGVNFADIYRRRGDYHIEDHSPPYINGYEGVGEVVKIGKNIKSCSIGEDILFVDVPFANAELVSVPKENIIKIPKNMNIKLAASIGLQGLTAEFLANDLGQNVRGDKAFIYGISGGVGQILSQILGADGVDVYGLTSSIEKQETALKQGAREVFLKEEEWFNDVQNSFDTVYDGVGITVQQSIDLTKNRGKVVLFGMAGGTPPQVNLIELLTKSKSILTGDLWDYLTSYEEREERSKRLFQYFVDGQITISEPTIFRLRNGKDAHEFLEAGKNIGKVLLTP
ncbi:alcohol dehydrogenase [Tetragenococcus halophilus]|uniref:Alcohol dehydrogenase n=1 Tax=Tetragenococcus halophilus TaxID=51669 RepID=A0A3G5FKK8_TETHA|nr:zinc-binding dehydrogenase [Tetragenococcus halophilus]AYW50658.1 alcohol dehydrogenase [Tetragenococcus halophilus]GBD63987.1 putative oxidoreductase [Tetragenococcus halophilus subsp. flandriensis]